MMKRLLAVCCTLALAGSVACGEVDDDQPEDEPTGLQLASSVDYKSDVKYMRYNVYKVDLGPNEKCKNVDPNDVISQTPPDITDKVEKKKGMTMPGSWDRFHDKPLDELSQHKFFDLFLHVKKGCYVAHAIPLDEAQEAKTKCLPTHGVFNVKPKKMTEGIMISQCLTKPKMGTLDMIVALNKRPKIKDITLEPQKFNECPIDEDEKPSVTSCVKVVEPDKDPVKLEWALKERDEDGKLVKDDDGKPVLKDPFFQIGPDGTPVDYTDPENNNTNNNSNDEEDPDHSPVQAVNYYPDDNDFDYYFKELVKKDGKVKTVRVVEACIEIKFERSHEHTSADIAVTAFDMLWDYDKVTKMKELIKFEDWFYDRKIFADPHVDDNDDNNDGNNLNDGNANDDNNDVDDEPTRIKSRDTRQFAAYNGRCAIIDGKLACNQSRGFWANDKNEDVWDLTDFDRETETVCTGEDLEKRWIDLLKGDYSNQYASLAWQFITAKLNYEAVSWTNVDQTHSDDDDILDLADLLALVLDFTDKIVNDVEGKDEQAPLCEELPPVDDSAQAAAINNLIDERLKDIYEGVTTFEDAFAGFGYYEVDRETLMDILEDFNDQDPETLERYCLAEEEDND